MSAGHLPNIAIAVGGTPFSENSQMITKPCLPFPSENQDVVAFRIKRHNHAPTEEESISTRHDVRQTKKRARARVDRLGLQIRQAAGIPQHHLPIGHFRKLPPSPGRESASHQEGQSAHAGLTPVVMIRSRSPNQTTREPLIPPCPSAVLIGSAPALGSKIRILLSLHVCREEG